MTPATYLIGEGTENQEKFNAKGQQSVYKKILFQNIQEQNQLVKNNKSLITNQNCDNTDFQYLYMFLSLLKGFLVFRW